MKNKRDSDSDRESSSSYSYCNKTDCSQCSESTDCSTSEDSNQSRIQSPQLRKGKKNVYTENNVRSSSSSKISDSRSSIVENPKPKFDWKSFTKPTENRSTKERQKNKVSSPSITEKRPKNQTSAQKKNEVIESSKPNSSESSSKKSIMPKLRALDKKDPKTKRKKAENEHETDGSELESDFFIEKPAMKKMKENSKDYTKGDAEANQKKRGEGKEKFTWGEFEEEDQAIISFYKDQIRLSSLHNHFSNTFPNRTRRDSTIHHRRELLFKKWRETVLNSHSLKDS